MRISYPTLLLLGIYGDESAAIMAQAWGRETLVIDDGTVQAYYHLSHDYYQMKVEGGEGLPERVVVVPYRWRTERRETMQQVCAAIEKKKNNAILQSFSVLWKDKS